MTTIKNSGGNRALVVYCYKGLFPEWDQIQFSQITRDILNDLGVKGWKDEYCIIDPERTVDVALFSGAWERSLKIGNCGGDLIVGVYFYTAPPTPEPDPDPDPDDAEKWREYMSAYNAINQDEEPEPEPEPAPSITSLVCNALQEAFPDGKVGASSFVINPDLIDFELEIE